MKALILYRSFHGNTKQVAEAIAQRLGQLGHLGTVQDVRLRLPGLADFDAVFNGAPTRFARVNWKSVAILKKLKKAGIGQKPIAIFDTCAMLPTTPEELEESGKWIIPGAAGILHKAATDLGLNVYADTLRCEVNGVSGPPVEGALEKATTFTNQFVAATTSANL